MTDKNLTRNILFIWIGLALLYMVMATGSIMLDMKRDWDKQLQIQTTPPHLFVPKPNYSTVTLVHYCCSSAGCKEHHQRVVITGIQERDQYPFEGQ